MIRKLIVSTFFAAFFIYGKNNHNLEMVLKSERSNNMRSNIDDKWIAIDKIQHFSYSLLISLGCQYVLVNKIGSDEKSALPISSAFSLTAGITKELNDRKGKNGFFSFKDMIANFCGVIVAAFIIYQ